MTPAELVGLLEARTSAEVGAVTGLGVREVVTALQKLQAGGLVDETLAVRVELLEAIAA